MNVCVGFSERCTKYETLSHLLSIYIRQSGTLTDVLIKYLASQQSRQHGLWWSNTYLYRPDCPHWCIGRSRPELFGSMWFHPAGEPWHSSQSDRPQPLRGHHYWPLMRRKKKRVKTNITRHQEMQQILKLWSNHTQLGAIFDTALASLDHILFLFHLLPLMVVYVFICINNSVNCIKNY